MATERRQGRDRNALRAVAALLLAISAEGCSARTIDSDAGPSCTPDGFHSCVCPNQSTGVILCDFDGRFVCVCELDASGTLFDASDDRPWPRVFGADSSLGMDVARSIPDGAAEIDGAICATATEPTLFLAGDSTNSIHPGVETLTGGVWSSRGSTPSSITIQTDAGDTFGGWTVAFAAPAGSTLETTFYPGAVRAGFNGPLPGLDVGGHAGCGTVNGSFDIRELLFVDGGLSRITATFEQRCDGSASVLRGCIHFR